MYRYVYKYIYIYILVGGIPTPVKNMKVDWDNQSHFPVTTNQILIGFSI